MPVPTAERGRTTPRSVVSVSVRMPDGRRLTPCLGLGLPLIDGLIAFGLPVRANATSPVGVSGPAGQIKRFIANLLVTADLDGHEIEIPAECLVPQTYWIAG